MTVIHTKEFPYAELRTPTGDFYDCMEDMHHAGFEESQMWSVTEGEDEDGETTWCYGPVHHYINLLGFIATAEHHDGVTYYNEPN